MLQMPAEPSGTDAERRSERKGVRPHPVSTVFFVLGVIVLSVASVFVHGHPQPYPLDLDTTLTVQHLHAYPWVNAFIEFVSSLNDPTPTLVVLALWLVLHLSLSFDYRLDLDEA
jgi:hypothetical protein